jgi:putative hydrolase of the HAD superfamily
MTSGPGVVMFDLDDTLFQHRESVVAGIHGHRSALGGVLAALDARAAAEHWNALEEEHYHRYLTGELDYLGQRRARARGFVERHGLAIDDDAAAEAWFEDYLVHYRAAWALHDDVIPCLEALRPARFGLITNGERAFQQAKIDRVALGAWLDDIVASGEVGITKPDPRIFVLACERQGVSPADAAYVGDRLHTDAIGATAAGLHGIWIDRLGVATDAELAEAAEAGVPVIRTLAELPGILL